MLPPRLGIKFLPGVTIAFSGARPRGIAASCGRFAGISPTHSPCAFALAPRTDVGLAFAFLLRGPALRFLAFSAVKIAPVSTTAFIFGFAGFLQGYRNGLAPALDFAGFAAAAAFEFAVLEFMHDPAGNPPLAR